MRILNSLKNHKALSVFSSILIIIIILFLVRTLWTRAEELKSLDFSFTVNYFFLFIFFLTIGTSIILIAFGWVKILKKINSSLWASNSLLFKVFMFAWLSRYIPTKLFPLFTRISLLPHANISKKKIALSWGIEQVFHFLSLTLLSFPLLSLLAKKQTFFSVEILHATVLVALLIIFYIVFLKKFRRSPTFLEKYFDVDSSLPFFFHRKTRVEILGIYISAFLFWGISLFFLINSFIFLPVSYLAEIIGMSSFVTLAGFLVIFTGGGIGVREGALFLLLQYFIPLNLAIIIPLLFRIGSIFVEIVLFFGAYFLNFYFRKKVKIVK